MRGGVGLRGTTSGVHRQSVFPRFINQALTSLLSGVAIAALVLSGVGVNPSFATPGCAIPIQPDGAGTVADKYRISSAGHLTWLAERSGGNPIADRVNAHYVMTSTINLEDCSWAPIGSASIPFSGSLDGGGNSIQGLLINSGFTNSSDTGAGLFASIVGGSDTNRVLIQNLIIENALVEVRLDLGGTAAAVQNIALVAGVATNVDFDALTVSGEVRIIDFPTGFGSGTGSSNRFGTIAGTADSNVTIRDTLARADLLTGFTWNNTGGTPAQLNSGAGQVGGLIGYASENVHVDSSAWEGSIVARTIAGGLIGLTEDRLGNAISKSRATGDITTGVDENAPGNGTGGLIGEGYGKVEYSAANVSVQGNSEVGGLLGNNQMVERKNQGIWSSYARGDVRLVQRGSSFVSAGGLSGKLNTGLNVGQENYALVENSYSSGLVSASLTENNPYNFSLDLSKAIAAGFSGVLREGAEFEDEVTKMKANFWLKPQGSIQRGLDRTFASDDSGELIGDAPGKVLGISESEMTNINTYLAAGWAIVEGWEPFDAPGKVWGICPAGSDNVVNDGYPFLLWEYDSNPCVNEPDTVLGGGSAPGAATPVEKRAASPAIHLDLQANVGDRVSGASVVVGGEGLSAGSSMNLVVRSTPQTLVSGRVSSLGNFSTRASLPALSPGSHTLTLTGTAPDGAVLTLTQGFVVGADGTFTSIGQPAGSQSGGLAATGVPENAGVLFTVSSLMLLAIGLSLLRARSRHQFTE